MTPIAFPEATIVMGENQPEYLPLPTHISSDPTSTVTSCWELNDLDVASILRHRKIWLQQLTFGNPLQPQRPTAAKPCLHP